MRILFFLLISYQCIAQVSKPNNIIFNAGNNTPFVGVSYHRLLYLPSKDSLKTGSHFDIGVGLGWIPTIDFYNKVHSTPIAYTHNIEYVRGRKFAFLTIGYAGIFSPRDRFINQRYVYTPNISIGVRFEFLSRFLIGFKANSYFYATQTKEIRNENELYRISKFNVGLFPGAYFGFNF